MAVDAFIKAHPFWRMSMAMPRWPKRALATRVNILIRCPVARGIRPAEDPHIELLFKKEKHTRGKENET